MTLEPTDRSLDRPVLRGRVSQPRTIPGPQARSSDRIQYRNGPTRRAHLDDRFGEAIAEFAAQVDLATSLNAADPQLVLILEAVEDRTDLVDAATRAGLEVLVEADTAIEPDDDYALRSSAPRDPMIHTSLHAVCANQMAFDNLRRAWAAWKANGQVPGNAPLRDFFAHLRDIRPWSPQDRLKLIDWDDYFGGLLPDQLHPVELELWFRLSETSRSRSEGEVRQLIEAAGGTVTSTAIIPEIGYHGLSCDLPTQALIDMAAGHYDQVQIVKSSNVMYLRVTGQAPISEADPVEATRRTEDAPLPTGNPIVCVLDGVPVANHPLLDGRVIVLDPDDLASRSTVSERRHGTAMSSIVVWGDLAANAPEASSRPVLVRPILAPSTDTVNRVEEVPRRELVPDLMWRVFRELFEQNGAEPPIAPEVVIVNLSVGDPATPFDSIVSAWARMLDWLSYRYGVLVVVSAGNHPRLKLAGHDTETFTALAGNARREALLESQHSDWLGRRILSPAESINALTVGAIHADATSWTPAAYVEDPADGTRTISPLTALGGGHRRSLKPELAAPGGRATYSTPTTPESEISLRAATTLGPGIRVAHPVAPGQTFTVGTSAAAAAVTHQAARLGDTVDRIFDGTNLTRRQRAVAIKALLAHGTGDIDDPALEHEVIGLAAGNGMVVRDLSRGCDSNEAVVLYLGALSPKTAQDLLLPLPDGLAVRELKRVTATLAWLSPINWRHRQYRQAALSFVKPAGAIPDLGTPAGQSTDLAKRGSTTVQHLVWETNRSFGSGQGSSMSLTVKAFDQAGYQDVEPFDYAVAVSLWVAPVVGIDVYTQVRDQLQVAIRPTPAP